MISLATFVQQIKRRTKYGDPANISDQLTADIVHYTNQRRFRLWRRYPWYWSILEFTLPLVAGVIDYTLNAALGDIIAIENGAGGHFKKRTLKLYLVWHQSDSSAQSENPGDYVRMGQDAATKALKIKVWPLPAAAANRTGWGKQRISRYTVADLATNTDLEYFPEETIDVLEAGVLADVYEAQGKTADSALKNQFFQAEMERMVNEEKVEDDSEEQSDVPDYMAFHRRKRGGTTIT